MYIDGLIINAEVEDIIAELKKELLYQGVHKFAKSTDSGDDLMICCPFHKDGHERNPSSGIRRSDGMFHCFACGLTYSLPDFISHVLNFDDKSQGYKWLANNFASTEVYERGEVIIDCDREHNGNVSVPVLSTISDEILDTYRYVHPYMYKRGLTDAIIEKFDIGYDKSTDSITFPVRDKNGDCMFVARRSVKTKYFDLPKEINKPLYGMYELMQSNITRSDTIYVCEGLFDCLRLWCNDKLAVAGFGCLFSSYQIKQLQDLPVRSIILAFDNDEAGRKATDRVAQLLTTKLVYTVQLPSNRKDIGECTDEEINELEAEPI